MPLLLTPGDIHYTKVTVQTRRGTDVENQQIITQLPLLDMHQAEQIKQQHNYAVYRTNPCGYYNCHGMTFAARRTRIWEPKEIQKILNEDHYAVVSQEKVMPGDVVIYFQNGDAQHSGIVVQVDKIEGELTKIRILSKWGQGHEVIHQLRDCPYSEDADEIMFYRVISVHYGEL